MDAEAGEADVGAIDEELAVAHDRVAAGGAAVARQHARRTAGAGDARGHRRVDGRRVDVAGGGLLRRAGAVVDRSEVPAARFGLRVLGVAEGSAVTLDLKNVEQAADRRRDSRRR